MHDIVSITSGIDVAFQVMFCDSIVVSFVSYAAFPDIMLSNVLSNLVE